MFSGLPDGVGRRVTVPTATGCKRSVPASSASISRLIQVSPRFKPPQTETRRRVTRGRRGSLETPERSCRSHPRPTQGCGRAGDRHRRVAGAGLGQVPLPVRRRRPNPGGPGLREPGTGGRGRDPGRPGRRRPGGRGRAVAGPPAGERRREVPGRGRRHPEGGGGGRRPDRRP